MLDAFFELPQTHPLSFPQLVGYIAMALGVFAFAQKDDTRLKLFLVVMSVFLMAHFVLLERYVGAFSVLLAGSRAGLSIFNHARRHAHAYVVFYVIATIVLAYFTYQSWIDIFAFMAAITGTLAFFYLHGFWMRCALLFGGTLWLTHNVLALSYGPAVMEGLIMIANVMTIFRMRFEQQQVQKKLR